MALLSKAITALLISLAHNGGPGACRCATFDQRTASRSVHHSIWRRRLGLGRPSDARRRCATSPPRVSVARSVHRQRVPLGTSPTPRSAQTLSVPAAHPIAITNQRACGAVSQVKTLTVIVDDEAGSRTQNGHFVTCLRRKVCIFTPALRSHPPNASPSTGTLSLD